MKIVSLDIKIITKCIKQFDMRLIEEIGGNVTRKRKWERKWKRKTIMTEKTGKEKSRAFASRNN